jgi:hypothetical protein
MNTLVARATALMAGHGIIVFQMIEEEIAHGKEDSTQWLLALIYGIAAVGVLSGYAAASG